MIVQKERFAQLKITLQGASAIPTGYAADAVSLGYGGDINFSYPFMLPNLELSLTTGYYYFGFKENLPDYDFAFSSIPLLRADCSSNSNCAA